VKQGLIVVEGQTEEAFVRDVLSPYLRERFGLWLDISIVMTKRVATGSSHKGGLSTYKKLKGDLLRRFGSTHFSVVTTLFDYYGFPDDAPGMSDRPVGGTPRQRAQHVQDALARDLDQPHFLPFLALHETEAWLFCGLDEAAWAFPEGARLHELRAMRDAVASPEDISDGYPTAPSRRILSACPAYQKATTGPMVLEAIGVERIRRHCPHFDSWICALEAVTR
jgi:hypothetical protein